MLQPPVEPTVPAPADRRAEVRGTETLQVESGHALSSVGENAPPSPAPSSPVLPPQAEGELRLRLWGRDVRILLASYLGERRNKPYGLLLGGVSQSCTFLPSSMARMSRAAVAPAPAEMIAWLRSGRADRPIT